MTVDADSDRLSLSEVLEPHHVAERHPLLTAEALGRFLSHSSRSHSKDPPEL